MRSTKMKVSTFFIAFSQKVKLLTMTLFFTQNLRKFSDKLKIFWQNFLKNFSIILNYLLERRLSISFYQNRIPFNCFMPCLVKIGPMLRRHQICEKFTNGRNTDKKLNLAFKSGELKIKWS